eukprot:CAMPEP_0172634082 /NCGR_PEP_ID=MMETSP1068-20121228/192775_1 /TAXON_ID=35684 /ORGANISM="Pseudopedinella elastica, Strain CCMP716" /LENGTH=133 /DNA_ID=CAMNT_0013445943 /DNA_START=701 /DNA_END=1102 /DNA_ORIENTATION=-
MTPHAKEVRLHGACISDTVTSFETRVPIRRTLNTWGGTRMACSTSAKPKVQRTIHRGMPRRPPTIGVTAMFKVAGFQNGSGQVLVRQHAEKKCAMMTSWRAVKTYTKACATATPSNGCTTRAEKKSDAICPVE